MVEGTQHGLAGDLSSAVEVLVIERMLLITLLAGLLLLMKVTSDSGKCCEGKCLPGNEKYYSFVQVNLLNY